MLPFDRGFVPPSVALSTLDKARQLILSDDQLTCFGANGGYRMVRATHGVHSGRYYWEAVVMESEEQSDCHFRVGWSMRQGELQAPLGYDRFGFAYRDVNGATVTASNRNDNYGQQYGVGDVVGCYIYLDDDEPNNNEIRFFKNGVDQGTAYCKGEVPMSVYFPAISIFEKGVVRVNFGPSFIYKHDVYGANALSEVQPMSPEDRKEHEQSIHALRNWLRIRQEQIANSEKGQDVKMDIGEAPQCEVPAANGIEI